MTELIKPFTPIDAARALGISKSWLLKLCNEWMYKTEKSNNRIWMVWIPIDPSGNPIKYEKNSIGRGRPVKK